MLRLTSTNGAAIYFAPSAVEAVWTGPGGPATVFTGNESFSVRESAAEVVALIESSRQPADYAPIVDAARRLVEWQDSADVDLDAHEQIVEAARAALAAYVKGEGR